MSDETPTPNDDEPERTAHDREVDTELAPEERLLRGWLPEATPTEGPAPAP